MYSTSKVRTFVRRLIDFTLMENFSLQFKYIFWTAEICHFVEAEHSELRVECNQRQKKFQEQFRVKQNSRVSIICICDFSQSKYSAATLSSCFLLLPGIK